MDDYIALLIERVERRYRQAQSNERVVHYGERVTILHGLHAAVYGDHP